MTSSRNQSVKLRLLWVACLLNGPLNLTLRERPSWIVAKATHYGSFIKAGIYYPQRVWKHFCSYKKKDRCTLYAIITGSGRQCAKNSRPWTNLFLPAWELNAFTLQSLQLRRLNPLWRQFNGSRVSNGIILKPWVRDAPLKLRWAKRPQKITNRQTTQAISVSFYGPGHKLSELRSQKWSSHTYAHLSVHSTAVRLPLPKSNRPRTAVIKLPCPRGWRAAAHSRK